uniref:F-box domain-containing protein n=2 Tax=Clastoptera arizonana TaxID=38151 RepID=A0A1B6DU40_9HEMI
MEVCNIRCPLAMGVIPTLQCHICLCLYHPECIGLEEAMTRTIHSYKCKSCQLLPAKPTLKPITSTSSSIISPPPLTPISSFSTASSANSFTNTSVSNPPPVLTRLTDGKLVNVPRTSTKTAVPKAHSIVGGLTTWLPPSSTIQLSPSTPKLSSSYKNISPAHTSTVDSSSSLPTQTLITMNKKRFIVMPKHNVLSVSPAVTAPSITVADPSSSQITTPSELSPSLTNLSTQAYGPGGPILPKPTPTSGGATFVVSSPATPSTTFQNPPGVLLVPYLPQNTQPTGNGGSPTQLPPQYVIVNGPSGLQAGNFIFGNLPQQQLKLPTVPTSQAAEPPSESAGTKRVPENLELLPLPPSKKLQTSEKYSNRLIENHLQDTSILYNALLTAFQYLTVKELLRAAVVSRLFRDLALHSSLWQTVRLKNCRVRDWAGAAQTLSRAATRHLDLKKSIIPDKSDSAQKADIWGDFINCISKVKTLVKLDLCKCTSQIVQQVAVACPQLESLIAIAIRSSELNLSSLGGCRNMTELKLKSVNPGFELTNITALKDLTNLKHLALTSIKNLNSDIVVVLNNMEAMETLELGECMKLPESFISESLSKMTKLRRLRLEKGQGSECPTLNLLEKIGQCPSITQLELINFDVKNGFEVALANCSNIKTFLIIPTYITQSATTNHLIVEGVSKLSKTLTYFVWGLTLELLRVTDLFIDQWEVSKGKGQQLPQNSKKNSNDCIPIIKPDKQDIPKNKSAPLQVDVLQLSKLHKVLMTLLPKTQVKILKVPFSATWRQTIPGTNQ